MESALCCYRDIFNFHGVHLMYNSCSALWSFFFVKCSYKRVCLSVCRVDYGTFLSDRVLCTFSLKQSTCFYMCRGGLAFYTVVALSKYQGPHKAVDGRLVVYH